MNISTTARQNYRTVSRGSLNGKRVLIVSHDEMLRERHELLLIGAGYETATAIDGEEAFTMLTLESFDLVLTDSQMPNLDGHGLVRALRADGNRIPVILFSGSLSRVHDLPADLRGEIAAAFVNLTSDQQLLAGIGRAIQLNAILKNLSHAATLWRQVQRKALLRSATSTLPQLWRAHHYSRNITFPNVAGAKR